MMLDNKNEQKWPLTEKEVLKKNKQSRVISFAFSGSRIVCSAAQKKKAADCCPNIFNISKINLVCQLQFVHNCLNLCFARIEIIQFVQYSVLKYPAACDILYIQRNLLNRSF